ncbi:MAG: SAM-dependent DNA methyltransferase, partial [Anaerolineae bacterium]|nr:SAM-dependent DNA methyltransferase [Anaerolineae bacterium]
VRWLLWGFGDREMEPEIKRIPADVRAAWYTDFNLANLLHSHVDWSATILQGNLPGDDSRASKFARGTGFYSTPIEICKMMADMTFIDGPQPEQMIQTVCDPACGTGSMLLPASNHSLCLFGQDIVYDLVLCSKLNGFLFMPWLVYMPEHMVDLFEKARAGAGVPEHKRAVEAGISLTNDPARVAEITAQRAAFREACQAGALQQAPLF